MRDAGGTGLIVSKTAAILPKGGDEAAASPIPGVNGITGKGGCDRDRSPTESNDRSWNMDRQAPSYLSARAEERMP